MLSSTTFFIGIIALIQSLQSFDITMAMTQGGPNYYYRFFYFPAHGL